MSGQNTHVVELGGETVECTTDNWQAVADRLVAKHGGIPKVRTLTAPKPVLTLVAPAPSTNMDDRSSISESGAMRSTMDLMQAQANGFAPKKPYFERGTKVIDVGVDNARQARADFDEMPSAADAAMAIAERVQGEHRQDRSVETADIRMNKSGELVVDGQRLLLEDKAIHGLAGRLGCGGGSYLAKCWPELRAVNVNNWARALETQEAQARQAHEGDASKRGEFEPSKTVLRTRNGSGPRSVFALVSPGYTSFDVDRIAEALRRAVPDGAKGVSRYDGYRAQFQVLFHTDVAPEEFVAGEFFRAGVYVDAADDGTGSIKVRSVLWQNLCLNLICIDQAQQMVARIRHVGSVSELARRFHAAFRKALSKVEPFMRQWGFGVREDALGRALAAADLGPVPIDEALPGLMNGIIERELVPIPLKAGGGREQVVKDLVRMYQADTSAAVIDPRTSAPRDYVSRAAVVNAFTRYAHEVNQDPWAQQGIEAGAGELLWPARNATSPAPLPYVPMGG